VQRRETVQETFSPTYREALACIHHKGRRRGTLAAVLEELQKIRAAGGDWPRHQKTDAKHERTWVCGLHKQRINYRAGRLTPVKVKRLAETLPGGGQALGQRGCRRQPR
jgi:hypothetical protein